VGIDYLQALALPQTNIHYHLGAEHKSDEYNDSTESDAYDAEMARKHDDEHHRRKLNENPRPGWFCPISGFTEAQLQPYEFQHCKGDHVRVGATYEVHFVRSSAGKQHMLDPTRSDLQDRDCTCEGTRGKFPDGHGIGEHCAAWDEDQPYCDKTSDTASHPHGLDWCHKKWCFVSPDCSVAIESDHEWAYWDLLTAAGHDLPRAKFYYSYEACGNVDLYTPMLHGDGLSYAANNLGQLNPTVLVFAVVFVVVNDPAFDDDDLFGFTTSHDGKHDNGFKTSNKTVMYPGSTTGTSHDNDICSPYTVTWHVDTTCNVVSAKSFDKLCFDMNDRSTEGLDADLAPHGSRKLVDPEFVVAAEYVRHHPLLIGNQYHEEDHTDIHC